MPFTQAWCPCVGGIVPLTHWREGNCPAPPLHLPTIEGMLQKIEGDKLHCGGKMTPTRLMSCPRRVLIQDFKNVYWDPRAEHSAFMGTMWHEVMQKYAAPGAYVEIEFPVPGGITPTFLGVPIRGKVDFIKKDFSGIHDYKTHRSTKGGKPWELGRPVSDENTAQLNIYRMIVKQVVEKDPLELEVKHSWRAPSRPLPDVVDLYDREATNASAVAEWSQKVPVRNEAWVAAVKPFGAAYSIGEIFDMYLHFFKQLRAGMGVDEAINELPMVGQMQFWGKGCTDICAPGVRDECYRIAGQA